MSNLELLLEGVESSALGPLILGVLVCVPEEEKKLSTPSST